MWGDAESACCCACEHVHAVNGFWHGGLFCGESARKCAKVREKCAKVRESVGWATSGYSAKVCESEDCLAMLKLRKWRGPVHVLKLRK